MSSTLYIIEIGNTCWAIGQVLAVTTSCSTAWAALGAQQHGCVIEIEPGVWVACRIVDVKPSAAAARIATDRSAFESRRQCECEDDPQLAVALGQLLFQGKVRFERPHGRDEIWFAI
jgi:hypothetical protein